MEDILIDDELVDYDESEEENPNTPYPIYDKDATEKSRRKTV